MNDDSDRPKVTGKALRVNRNSVRDRDSAPLPVSPAQRSDRPRKVDGNALRVNDKSVDGGEPTRSPAPYHKQ